MALRLTLREHSSKRSRRTWHGMAFIMEALVLLVFLVASIAILMQLFGDARSHDENASTLTASVILASNEAERFTMDPSSDSTAYYAFEDDALIEVSQDRTEALKVTRTVDSTNTEAGTLYHATITVEQYDLVIYEMDSARYVSGTEVDQ